MAGSMSVLMRFVWRSLGVGLGCLGEGGCVFGVWVGSQLWTSGIVYMPILTISMLNSIWPKCGLSEVWKYKIPSSIICSFVVLHVPI